MENPSTVSTLCPPPVPQIYHCSVCPTHRHISEVFFKCTLVLSRRSTPSRTINFCYFVKRKKNYSKYLKPYLKDLTLIILSYVFVTRFFPNHDFAPLLELTFSKFFLAQKSLWTFKITHPAATSRNFALDFLTFHDSGARKVKCQLWCDYVVGDVKNFYQSNDIKINNWKM